MNTLVVSSHAREDMSEDILSRIHLEATQTPVQNFQHSLLPSCTLKGYPRGYRYSKGKKKGLTL